MINHILNEELGISNDVISLKNKIKNLISNDYAYYNNDNHYYGNLRISSKKVIRIFYNKIITKFDNVDIKINYYVIDSIKYKNYLDTYITKYSSGFDLNTNELYLFLHSANNKIVWREYDETLQHEIEHWYQQYRKGNTLLSNKRLKNYNNNQSLLQSDNYIEYNIGMIYYYDNKIECDAIMNGLYSKIMSYNEIAYAIKPIEILKEYRHYKNIKAIQEIINHIDTNEYVKNEYLEVIENNNKNFNSFLKIANRVVDEYIKGFGRTLYKAKRDLDDKYKNMIY